MMRVGRNVRGELGPIVVDARSRRQLPAHEGGAPWRTERRGSVVVGKTRGPRGERSEVRRDKVIGRPVGKQRPVELIDHDDQYVWTPAHRRQAALSLASTKSSTSAAALA